MKVLAWVSLAVAAFLELYLIISIFYEPNMDGVAGSLFAIIFYAPTIVFPILYLRKGGK